MMKRVIGICGLAGLLSVAGLAAGSEVADAAMHKDKAALTSLIQKKADVNAAQTDGATALLWAAQWDDMAMVDQLIKAGANANAANHDGATAMYAACINGNAAMIEALIKAGVDVNAPFLTHGETALMFAARTGNPAAVKVLLDHGANVNAHERLRETTAMMWAAEQDHADVIKMLADKGADVNVQGKKEKPQKQYGANDNSGAAQWVGGLTALVLASREGAIESVKTLLDLKADINKASGDNSTALLVAIQNGHYDVATFLVNHGANIDLVNDKGWSPLYLAVKHRTIETGTIPVPNSDQAMPFIKLILEKGVNVNVRSKSNTEIRNGQRATWFNEAGATPFMRAALCGDIEVMKMLLAKGADPKIQTNDHTTALMAAAGVGYSDGFIHDISEETTVEAMKLLLDLGADVNARNDKGMTALHGAAHKASLPEIQLLVDRGGDLGIKDKGNEAFGAKAEGLIPLNWAEGVTVGVQSAIFHAEAVDLITKLMKEKNIPFPNVLRTVGGNAKANTIKGVEGKREDTTDKK